MLQFRSSLISHSLRCVNDGPTRETAKLSPSRTPDPTRPIRARLTSGRVGPCARDLVSACQRCGNAVCRNCVARVQPARLPQRHRRLCTVCLHAPLAELTGLDALLASPTSPPAFTAPAFVQAACACHDGAYLCRLCAQRLPGADTTYRRIWAWRTRYSREGIGTGIGEGTEGVKCARGQACRVAEETEVELDCGPDEEPASPQSETALEPWAGTSADETLGGTSNRPGTPSHGDRGDAGYLRQEIEGIGGVVRGKVKKRVRVGHPVREFEDERDRAVFLEREVNGERRSWCGWCERVILATDDAVVRGLGEDGKGKSRVHSATSRVGGSGSV